MARGKQAVVNGYITIGSCPPDETAVSERIFSIKAGIELTVTQQDPRAATHVGDETAVLCLAIIGTVDID